MSNVDQKIENAANKIESAANKAWENKSAATCLFGLGAVGLVCDLLFNRK